MWQWQPPRAIVLTIMLWVYTSKLVVPSSRPLPPMLQKRTQAPIARVLIGTFSQRTSRDDGNQTANDFCFLLGNENATVNKQVPIIGVANNTVTKHSTTNNGNETANEFCLDEQPRTNGNESVVAVVGPATVPFECNLPLKITNYNTVNPTQTSINFTTANIAENKRERKNETDFIAIDLRRHADAWCLHERLGAAQPDRQRRHSRN